MSKELSLIAASAKPQTRENLGEDLRGLGVEPGMTLLVHSSLSKLGWVCGGAVAVVQALMDVLTPKGTLIMPTHTTHYSDPAYWEAPAVPESWWETIRNTMPAFDRDYTASFFMGAIPETFRQFPDVIRSNHPQVSFAAWGEQATEITSNHSLHYGLSEESPLGKIYEAKGMVLLLGVGYENNTSFHLSEYRSKVRPVIKNGAPIWKDGVRIWQEIEDLDIDSERFAEIGILMEQQVEVTKGKVGSADAILFQQRAAVDFATTWFKHTYKEWE
ncbi:aminoglycoside N(3)-acetyltransferase [Rubeoparvulum massiliense]|uniref:aminoglycoside N(3)-acetyltransferase n=1 Tax=Rubeoparvulum massiliense TaxID=1631346 RepID=UPI00065E057A|nr:AAC(3) family N-acetyltransferase [Rubeoparvulum massiliense]